MPYEQKFKIGEWVSKDLRDGKTLKAEGKARVEFLLWENSWCAQEAERRSMWLEQSEWVKEPENAKPFKLYKNFDGDEKAL